MVFEGESVKTTAYHYDRRADTWSLEGSQSVDGRTTNGSHSAHRGIDLRLNAEKTET